MLVYNITAKVEKGIAEAWLRWQMDEHIPEIMATNLFIKNKIFQLIDQPDEDGITYVIQYFTESRKNYEHYIAAHAPGFIEKAIKTWGDKFITFKTLMQSVQ